VIGREEERDSGDVHPHFMIRGGGVIHHVHNQLLTGACVCDVWMRRWGHSGCV
jgi:hypothetical protein